MSNAEYFDYGHKPRLTVFNSKEDADNGVVLKEYRKYLETGEIFEQGFSKVTPSGDFEIYNKEVKILMPANESTTYGGKAKSYNVSNARKLLRKYQVIVTGIDSEALIVTVSHTLAVKREREDLRNKLLDELSKEKNKKVIKLPAKVVWIDSGKNAAVVDLCRVGLYGYVPAARWAQTYVGELGKVTKTGDQIDVVVLGYRKKPLGKNSANMFLCSRKEFTKDPWIGIENRFKKNDIVLIECVELREKSWFGKIQGLDDIQVFCEYPDKDKVPEDFRVVLGELYEGFIYSVSEERHLLKARVFKHIIKAGE